jgi:hypothetical protein
MTTESKYMYSGTDMKGRFLMFHGALYAGIHQGQIPGLQEPLH